MNITMKITNKILYPSYVKSFKCIADACEDSCCVGWDIDVDKITFRKYFRTDHPLLKQEFRKQLYINEDCDCDDVDYGRIRINQKKHCAFLEESGFCRIYNELGEDYLSNVCYSYPRVYNVVNGVYEVSLFMSCPEALRIMMADTKPLSFQSDNQSLPKHIIHGAFDSKRMKKLRSTSIQIIQDRSLPFIKRLIKLGVGLQGSQNDFISMNTDVVNRDAYQFDFYMELMDSLQISKELDSPEFVKISQKVVDAFSGGSGGRDSHDIHMKSKKEIFEPFLQDNFYLFEHYLVNFMFQSNFPFSENQEPFDGYLMLVIRFAFLRFYLIGLGAAEGQITGDDVIVMIRLFTKSIEHHKSFFGDLLLSLKAQDLDNMASISLLL